MTGPAPDWPELLARLFLREGSVPGEHDDADFHRARIRWEWASGQWALLAGDDKRLWGWVSWYRCTDEVLDLLAHLDHEKLIERGSAARDLTQGCNLYIATVLVAPGAPPETMQNLARLARARNLDAVDAFWHHRKPDGRSRIVRVPMAEPI